MLSAFDHQSERTMLYKLHAKTVPMKRSCTVSPDHNIHNITLATEKIRVPKRTPKGGRIRCLTAELTIAAFIKNMADSPISLAAKGILVSGRIRSYMSQYRSVNSHRAKLKDKNTVVRFLPLSPISCTDRVNSAASTTICIDTDIRVICITVINPVPSLKRYP